jgi:hypothetical protein
MGDVKNEYNKSSSERAEQQQSSSAGGKAATQGQTQQQQSKECARPTEQTHHEFQLTSLII